MEGWGVEESGGDRIRRSLAEPDDDDMLEEAARETDGSFCLLTAFASVTFSAADVLVSLGARIAVRLPLDLVVKFADCDWLLCWDW